MEEITYTLNMEMTTGQSDAQFSARLRVRETSPTEVQKRQDVLWMCSEREGRDEL